MGLFKRKTYVVHSALNLDLALMYEKGEMADYYIPGRDCKSTDPQKVIDENIQALRKAKEPVIIIWDSSNDVSFWMGIAYAFKKKCELISAEMFKPRVGKSGKIQYDA